MRNVLLVSFSHIKTCYLCLWGSYELTPCPRVSKVEVALPLEASLGRRPLGEGSGGSRAVSLLMTALGDGQAGGLRATLRSPVPFRTLPPQTLSGGSMPLHDSPWHLTPASEAAAQCVRKAICVEGSACCMALRCVRPWNPVSGLHSPG